MTKKKQRSVFWVVSTHVLTTGLVMPLFAVQIGCAILRAAQPSALVGLVVLLSLQSLGYFGGVYYSLSYIRDKANIANPVACVKPSIITFVVLCIVGFGINTVVCFARQGGVNPIVEMSAYLVCYIVICVEFAKVTQRGFAQMEPSSTADPTL